MAISIFDLFKQSFEKYLEGYLHHIFSYQPITDAYKYSIQNGGKRLRPSLVFLGAYAVAPRDPSYNPEELVVELAVGIELIHSYSLVHDDLPCMDNDSLRRGKPTTHVKYGAGMATITGDAMLNGAAELMLSALDNDYYMSIPFIKNNMLAQINATKYILNASGINGMIGGQCLDIKERDKNPSKSDLIRLYKLKTSALLRAALVAGAMRFEADDEIIKAFEKYADNFGIIFQIQDDILDITSTAEELGKEVNQDKNNNKFTYVDAAGSIENAKKDMLAYLDEAKSAIKSIEDKIQGAEYFYDLLDNMFARKK